MTDTAEIHERRRVSLPAAMILTAMAAGMGWGIRGQYGHETGAMIAGALASLTLVLLFAPTAASLPAARAAAMMTIGIGIGGSMTYGQTVGLTQDKDLIGNFEALRWGLLGLFVKGGIWIGFAATFLGMGLGGKRYRTREMLMIMGSLVGLSLIGERWINEPFDPTNRLLPRIYFSGDWYFWPDKADLRPRREVWGGLLTALVGLAAYARIGRGDKLAGRMAVFGFVGGGLGFSIGQCVQAFHAWRPEVFTTGALSPLSGLFKHFNWWNMMETTFGLIFGAIMALGLWLNRGLISLDEPDEEKAPCPTFETALLVVHLSLMLCSEFLRFRGALAPIHIYTGMGLVLAALPMIGTASGRLWPYFLLMPVVAAPICGKTLRNLSYERSLFPLEIGWLDLIAVPLAITTVAAVRLMTLPRTERAAGRFAATALLITAWLYFGLNTSFFDFAWPWRTWTTRTPNQIINGVCALCLTAAAVRELLRLGSRRDEKPGSPAPETIPA